LGHEKGLRIFWTGN